MLNNPSAKPVMKKSDTEQSQNPTNRNAPPTLKQRKQTKDEKATIPLDPQSQAQRKQTELMAKFKELEVLK